MLFKFNVDSQSPITSNYLHVKTTIYMSEHIFK